ncbi:Na+/H+ antiporter subunit E [Lutibaculum baratangense]|uniref:Cation antiporter n=1 Tax=Lutibaculum baratangense AMV1 TaxID=631454 RepID=V4RLI6_9HYPH|nr:Na+/H+ antiporter subunit E [Lutibaculum baratangense]ESR26881.1 cation antiporter [Lutibaculum baratangense AMV1]
MTATILPHPLLSLAVFVVWILLSNHVSVGVFVLAAVIAVAVPSMTAVYWPGRPSVRRPMVILEYAAIVLYDIVVSNIEVAKLVLFRRGDSLNSTFITVPLDLESPEAVTVLAGTITMTPGTLTADYDHEGHTLMVHCLNLKDEAEAVAQIKQRYESRLLRIFQ